MGNLGQEIYRSRDPQGWICVHEDAMRRYLAFGNQVEQSCMALDDPLRLEHVHTQAMMLGALFAQPLERATLLGLGGGSLAKALLHQFPGCRVQAVEQRAQVAVIARDYFALPHDPRLRVIIADAGDYLAARRKPSDLMFADLYQAEQMDAQQGELAFLRACRANLGPDGLLVANLWHQERKHIQAARDALDAVFEGRLLRLEVQSGNQILFAFAGPLPQLRRRELFAQARELGLGLRIPAQRLARSLWFQNAAALQLRQPGG